LNDASWRTTKNTSAGPWPIRRRSNPASTASGMSMLAVPMPARVARCRNQPGFAMPANGDLAIGLDGRRRAFVQCEHRREPREYRLDAAEYRIGRIGAVQSAQQREVRPVALDLDEIGSRVPSGGVVGEAEDVAGRQGQPDDVSGAGDRRRVAPGDRSIADAGA
jgi:hypothetical protein